MSRKWILMAALAATGIAVPQMTVQAQPNNRVVQERSEVSLFDVARERGNWAEANNVNLGGRNFNRALVANMNSGNTASVTIPVARRFERFRAWVGTRAMAGVNDRNVFRVIGDGRILFESNPLTKRSAPQQVDVSVRNVANLRLEVEQRGRAPKSGAIAVPVFIDTASRPNRPDRPDRPDRPPVGGGRNRMTVTQEGDGNYTVAINGNEIDFGTVSPQYRSGRVLVPMRRIFEEIGATVNYEAATQRILATKGNREVEMQLGSTDATIDGRAVTLDVPAEATLGTTLVPLRFISEAFNVAVDFQGAN